MNNRLLTLEEFMAEYQFWGEWEISYTDGTHLPESEYVRLGIALFQLPKIWHKNIQSCLLNFVL